jgi:hypothetical protein
MSYPFQKLSHIFLQVVEAPDFSNTNHALILSKKFFQNNKSNLTAKILEYFEFTFQLWRYRLLYYFGYELNRLKDYLGINIDNIPCNSFQNCFFYSHYPCLILYLMGSNLMKLDVNQ